MGVKLGQKWAVKDGNLLASNQVGSRFFNKEFDFSRASNGTYVDRDGLLKTAELYNLIPYSEDFSQWISNVSSVFLNETLGPNGVLNASLITSNNNGFYSRRLTFTYSTSTTYTLSIYAKYHSDQYLIIRELADTNGRAWFDLQNGVVGTSESDIDSSSIQDVGNGWYRCSISFTTSGSISNNLIDISSSNSDGVSSSVIGNGVYIFGAQLVLGTEPLDYQYTNGLQGLPRISFEDGVGHLLLEPQTTQLVPYSEDFSTYPFTGTITSESGYLAPDGTNTAYKITNGGSGALYEPAIVISTSTRSIYARSVSGTGTAQLLSHNSNTNNTFTLTEQWQRFEVNSAGVTGVDNFYAVDFRGGGTLDEIIVWGANATNNQTYATSYIKTEGTSVTRLADVCNNSGSAQDFNNEGVIYAEIAGLSDDSTYKTIAISAGTLNERVTIGLYENGYYFQIRNLGAIHFGGDGALDNVNSFNKIAIKYKENDFALWINGVVVETNSNGLTPAGLNQLNFDIGNGTYPFYGKARNLQVFTEALSDEELQQLTS